MKLKGLPATIRTLEDMLEVVGDRDARNDEGTHLSYKIQKKKGEWLAAAYTEVEDAIEALKIVRDSTMENYPPPCDKCGQSLPESD
jgi:hypothetical protein